ncbi:MAG: hypothetical protein RIQ47_447 [Bacteroidota bacterium]|jgi:hypothetical protein
MLRLLYLICFLFLLASCSNTTSTEKTTVPEANEKVPVSMLQLEAGQLYPSITGSISSRRFALYVPTNFIANDKFPLLLFLDPHADGEEPLEKYKELADQCGFILAASLDAKNGITLPESGTIVSDLLNEANNTLPIDPAAIYLVGFSGGAKAAIAAATSLTGIASVIYCGAAFPPNSLPVKIPSMAIAGLRDMNFSEVLYYTAALDTMPYRHSMLVTNNDHRWPTSSEFESALLWCMAIRCRSNSHCDTAAITKLSTNFLQSIDKEYDPILKDFKLRHYVACTEGIIDNALAKSSLQKNKNSPGFGQRLAQFTNELGNEQQFKQELQQAFQDKDINWWKNRLQQLRANKSDLVNQRLLGFVSLGAYMYSRNALDQTNTAAAAQYIELYRLADPENPEWAFLSACLSTELGDKTSALKWLQKSISLGLDDAKKLREEKLLQGLQNEAAFQSMVAQLER